MNILTRECSSQSLSASVEAVLAWVRTLWSVYADHCSPVPDSTDLCCSMLPLRAAFDRELDRAATPILPELRLAILDSLAAGAGESTTVSRAHFHAVSALSSLLGPEHETGLSQSDLKYYAMRSLRVGYDVRLSVSMARMMHALCATARKLRNERPRGLPLSDLQRALTDTGSVLVAGRDDIPPASVYANLFVELCAFIGALEPVVDKGVVELDVTATDPDFLLGQLFGLPTGIPGFDDVFGGGGPFLVDTPYDFAEPSDASGGDAPRPRWVGARTVLTVGPFGSGKSLLSLRVAVEVARKGGLALVLAPEQSAEECCFALEALGISTHTRSFLTIRDERGMFRALTAPEPGCGALVFIPAEDLKAFQSAFSRSIRERLSWLEAYPLRLLLIDPINAFVDDRGAAGSLEQTAFLRADIADIVRSAKQRNVNVWLTCEQTHEGQMEGRVEENVADTIIHLGFHPGSRERYIRVTKSRLQKEDPLEHTFYIGRGERFRVVPPTPALIRTRKPLHPASQTYIRMHIPGIDEILGERSVMAGDAILFDGPTGTAKTLLGLVFLLGSDREGANSLLVSDFEYSRMCELREIPTKLLPDRKKRVDLLSIGTGGTDPGQILVHIRDRLQRALDAGTPFDRVLVTNLTRWELEMPSLSTDRVFPVALLHLLRSYQVTSLIVTGHPDPRTESHLRNLMLESCDCVFDFTRFEFRGQERAFVRVLKTHDMMHRRARFEVAVDVDGATVHARESLLRFDSEGNVKPIRVSMFLHAETLNHERFNETLVAALRTSISPDCRIEPQNRRYDPGVMALGASSAIDEIQIIQLDEYQLSYMSAAGDVRERLHPYALPAGALDDRLPRLRQYVIRDRDAKTGAQTCVAIPFYENISLLAFRTSEFKAGFPGGWMELAEHCRAWETEHPDERELFFGCQVAQSDRFESYNCLFFEILYSFCPIDTTGDWDLEQWLSGAIPSVRRAAHVFRTLVRRSHLALFGAVHENAARPPSRPRASAKHDPTLGEIQQAHLQHTRTAIVWRHWYNTLNQVLSMLTPDERRDITVRALYGDERDPNSVHTTAGEWYLAVPAYSAAPEVALDIMRHLTTAEKELQRVHLGVGLPTRSAFYSTRSHDGTPSAAISKYFNVSKYFNFDMSVLERLVTAAFQRSRFRSYNLFAETISSHLLRILELPSALPDVDLCQRIDETINSLIHSFRFFGERSTSP